MGDTVSRLKALLPEPAHGPFDPPEYVPVPVASVWEIQGQPVLPGGEDLEEMLRQTGRLFKGGVHGRMTLFIVFGYQLSAFRS